MANGSTFLLDFFLQLNKSQIRYCVLRNYQQLPNSTGESDLDILIDKENAVKFLAIVKGTGRANDGYIVSFIASNSCPRICVMGSKDRGWGLMIDLHYDEITYRGHTILSNTKVWENTFQYKKTIMALNRKADALIGLLKELLNNGTCSEKYYLDFQNYALDKKFLDAVFLDIDKQSASDALLKSLGVSYSNGEIQRLVTALDKTFPKKRAITLHSILKFKRLFKQPGYSIAFLGTDGSGKSSLIDSIKIPLNAAFHQKVFYEHLRPNYLPSIARLMGKKEADDAPVTNPHAGSTSGFMGSLLRWNYYLLDYTVGFWVKIYKKKAISCCVWLFDRYYYDYLIDPRRTRVKLPFWILKLGQFFIPEPDIILCLGTDAQIIHTRKPELPFEEIERQVTELKSFCETHKTASWIDTGQTLDESSTEALEAIIKVMAKRFESIKLE